MLGDGIVSFGTAPDTVSRRNANASPKIVCSSVIGATACADGGAHSYFRRSLWNSTLIVSSWTFWIPPSW
jgi:hypothetical protein